MSLFNDSPLLNESPVVWTQAVLADFPRFLQDHASCERKAAALAMSFVTKYPDRPTVIEPMVCLAREELEHFHQVFKLMRKLNISLAASDEKDHYVNQMISKLRHGRDERFLDRLILSGIIEARGHERFHLLAQALQDEGLKSFYQQLADREAGHYKIFYNLAKQYFSDSQVDEAICRIAAFEAQAMISSPIQATLH